MKHTNQIPVPFPADRQQIQIMQAVIDAGNHAIASEGTDRFDLCTKIVEGGYMARCHCPQAGDVHQFSVTNKGRAAIKEAEPMNTPRNMALEALRMAGGFMFGAVWIMALWVVA